MIIEEGSKVKVYEGTCSSYNSPLIDEIEVYKDIEIEGTGFGYAMLLRNKGSENNSIFETNKIEKIKENEYIVEGYFKDALLVKTDRNNNVMYESYMDD